METTVAEDTNTCPHEDGLRRNGCFLTDGTPLEWTSAGGTVVAYGAVLLAVSGEVVLRVNVREWTLTPGAVAVVFPGDHVELIGATEGAFCLKMLGYTPELLGEASMRIELSVYELLRADCCIADSETVTALTRHLLGALSHYFRHPSVHSLRRQTLLGLQSWFLGFHDTVKPGGLAPLDFEGALTGAGNELFCRFMRLLSENYREQHHVAFYAAALAVTPKHLTAVVRRTTGHPAKRILSEYLLRRIKVSLLQSRLTVKELAYHYHFPSASRFCQFFREATGVTPLQFRSGVSAAE